MNYATSQAKRDAMRAYRQTPAGRAAAARANIAHRKRYRERQRARDAVKRAILEGRIIPRCCERCGDPKAEAHHPDYSQPLAVEWLCDPHHKAAHREMREFAKSAPFSHTRLRLIFERVLRTHQ
jgi:hypothetical protein